MRIGQVDIYNFQAIGEIHINLDGKGLVLVQGDNRDDTSQDSNGSGKSSVPDALHWCLFGVTARGQSGDDVINDREMKNTAVSVEIIDDDSSLYTVQRFRKHHEHKNALKVYRAGDGGGVTDLSKGTDKLTQQTVDQLIGHSEDVFCNAVYAAQENMPNLPAMTDKPLKMLIEEAAGIDRVQRACDIAQKEYRTAVQNLEVATKKVEKAREKLDLRRSDRESAATSRDAWTETQAENIKLVKAELKSALLDLKDLKAKAEKAEAGATPLREELAGIKAKIDGVESEKAEQERFAQGIRAARKALQSEEDEVQKAKLAVTRQETTVANLSNEAKRLKAGIDGIAARVGTPCGECGKPYAEADLEEAKNAQTRRLREKIEEHRGAKEKLAELQAVVTAAQDKVRLASEALERAQGEFDDYTASMTDVTAEIERERAINDSLSALKEDTDAYKRAAVTAKNKKENLDRMEAEINPHLARIEALEKEIADFEMELVEAEEGEEIASEKEVLARELVRVFGPAGVRAHILDTVTPFLNSRTSHYLGILSDGNITAVWSTISKLKSSDETREKFAIDVQSITGAKRYKGLSGGEKRKVRLATAMALQDLAASRAVKPLQLFMADEIDDSVDESGLERLMGLLDEKAREKGTVLVISHHSLGDWIREVVTVVKEGGKATLEGTALV